MASNVESVIAALRVALKEAEQTETHWWSVNTCNRWIAQLPRTWTRKWANLMIKGDGQGEVTRTAYIGHVRATLAYLETNRNAIEALRPWSWPFSTPRTATALEPIDAEFRDVAPTEPAPPKTGKPVRLIKN